MSLSSPEVPECSTLLCDTGYGIGVFWTAGVHRSGSLSSEPGLESPSSSSSSVSGVCPSAPVLAEPFAQGWWEGN